MHRSCLAILVIFVLAALVGPADAGSKRKRSRKAAKVIHVAASDSTERDERTTTVEVTVRKRPGERQGAAGTLPAGTEVVVEAEQGRWLRVRAGRISGYVTRTTLSAPKDAAVAAAPRDVRAPAVDEAAGSEAQISTVPARDRDVSRPTSWRTARDRETSTVTASALLATVTVPSATLRARPEAAAEQVASIVKGQRVVVTDARTHRGWIAVRDSSGHTGWIALHELGNDLAMIQSAGGADAPAIHPTTKVTQTRRAATDSHRRAWSLQLAVGAGYRALATEIETTGEQQQVAGSAGVARLEVDATASPLRAISIGVDAQVDLGRSGGTDVQATRGLAAGVRIGIRPRDLAELSVRGGLRRETTELTGTGVTEQLAGTTVGVRLDVSPQRSRLSARVELDTLVEGTWQQGDVAIPSAPRAMWAGMTIGVRIVGGVSVHAAFEHGRVSTAWSEMTMTEPVGARRVDASQLFQVGLSGAL
ncbi:MAG: SH3 domain-containing protein [Deltaproteobacteria bacterium]|nr:SH3 domain-containing protein [Deltaproteobacteria bacterium]MDQ3296142.1 SH3 domain-containing protein [Myxococcota bacterium]